MPLLARVFGFPRNAAYARASRLFDQGLYEEAIEEYQRACEESGGDALTARLARFYLAESHAKLGEHALAMRAWERAEAHYQAALSIHPHYPDLHYNLALARRGRGAASEALDALETALTLNPRFAKAYFLRGLLRYAAGNTEEALGDFASAAEIEPGYLNPSFRQARALHDLGDFQSAQKLFEAAAATRVDDIQFHLKLGDQLFAKDQVDAAIDEYVKALEINPAYADVQCRLGMALSARGKPDQAAAAFRCALEANPEYVEARTFLGLALREMGKPAEAAAEFEQVLALEPDNPIALQNLNDLRQAAA